MQRQPSRTALPNGLISGVIEGRLQLLRPPSTPLQCRGLRVPIGIQPNLKVQHRQLCGQQNHLPTVMHPRPQLSEGVRHLIRRQALWSSLKTTTGMPGTPPVLRHAINDDPVEVEDQEGAIIHGRKLGR